MVDSFYGRGSRTVFKSRTQHEMHHAKGAWLVIGRNCVRACGKLSADVRPVGERRSLNWRWLGVRQTSGRISRPTTGNAPLNVLQSSARLRREIDRAIASRFAGTQRKIKQHLVSRANALPPFTRHVYTRSRLTGDGFSRDSIVASNFLHPLLTRVHWEHRDDSVIAIS